MGLAAEIMGQQDINVLALQALLAALERPHDAIVAIVEMRFERIAIDETMAFRARGRGGYRCQHTADLA